LSEERKKKKKIKTSACPASRALTSFMALAAARAHSKRINRKDQRARRTQILWLWFLFVCFFFVKTQVH